jgi:hypothetical protein
MHGVAGLRVGTLEVEEVAGAQADAGASESNAGGGESAQTSGESGGLARVRLQLAHAESSLSG